MPFHDSSLTTINEESEISPSITPKSQSERNDFISVASPNSASIQFKPLTTDCQDEIDQIVCFNVNELSTSSIFKEPLFFFPELEDPGIEQALEEEEYVPIKDDGCYMYTEMCRDLKIYPLKKFCKSLTKKDLNLKYYVPVDNQMKAICKTLVDNRYIQEVTLQDNWLSDEACSYLSTVLEVNTTLRILNLKECRIGPRGLAILAENMVSSYIEDLDLSFNSLGDDGLKDAVFGLSQNIHLRKLNLSHNELSEASTTYLEEILTDIFNLKELDLSWNNLNTSKGMKKLCKGLTINSTISWLSLSWNGLFSKEAVLPIGKYLRKSKSLNYLDMSNNLLKGNSLSVLMKGVYRSESLNHIKIGNNIFSSQEAFIIARNFSKPTERPLKTLDMENMIVQKNFLNLLERIRHQGKDIKHGYVLSDYEVYGPYIPKVFFERCKFLGMKPKKKKRKVNFGYFVLSLPNEPITCSEFEAKLTAKKLSKLLDTDLITAIEKHYKIQKTGKIDCSKLITDYMMLYPETEPEPPKKKRAKKAKNKNKKGAKNEIKEELEKNPQIIIEDIANVNVEGPIELTVNGQTEMKQSQTNNEETLKTDEEVAVFENKVDGDKSNEDHKEVISKNDNGIKNTNHKKKSSSRISVKNQTSSKLRNISVKKTSTEIEEEKNAEGTLLTNSKENQKENSLGASAVFIYKNETLAK